MRFVTISATLVALAGCSSGSVAATRTTTLHPGGQRALLLEPARKPKGVVIYAHGAGGDENDIASDRTIAPIARELIHRGYAVADDRAHGNAWGNRASVQDYLALLDALRARGLKRVYLLAASMGGLSSLQLLDRARVQAWVGIDPVCDPGSLSQYRRQIRAANGGVLPARIRPRRLRGLRMVFAASYQDQVVPRRANTDACAADARRDRGRVTVRDEHGPHVAPSHFPPEQIAGLLTQR